MPWKRIGALIAPAVSEQSDVKVANLNDDDNDDDDNDDNDDDDNDDNGDEEDFVDDHYDDDDDDVANLHLSTPRQIEQPNNEQNHPHIHQIKETKATAFW